MGFAPRALLAGVLGIAAAFLAACGGGSGLLSSSQAGDLNASLDQLAGAVGAGQCAAAANAVTTFSNAVVNLPPSVSATLTRNLEQGASTVAQLAARDCQTTSTASTSTTTSSTSSTTSTPTTTSSTTTSTPTTTSTTPTTTSSTTATTQTGSGTTPTNSGSGGSGTGGGSGSGGAGLGGGGGNGGGNAQ